MNDPSIVFAEIPDPIVADDDVLDHPEPPSYFVDLNLDQVVDAVMAGYQEYALEVYFQLPLKTEDGIIYRQEVARDLEKPAVLGCVTPFAEAMRAMRSNLTLRARTRNPYQQQRYFLEAARTYTGAVSALARDLATVDLTSRGLRSFRAYLEVLAAAPGFTALADDVRHVLDQLAQVNYTLQIKSNTVTVRRYAAEVDYSTEVLTSFAKFKQGAVKDYRSRLTVGQGINHVEASVLELVARLYPATFASMASFCDDHRNYLDPVIAQFDRDVHLYTSYLTYIAPLRSAGLPFCYPRIHETARETSASQSFDLALAHKLLADGHEMVTNDFLLHGDERILVVSGPNQGGKTTFARMFGQVHHLASLGLPVPGTQAHLVTFDEMFTHFEKQEDLTNLTGKLEDDLVRVHQVLERATPRSLIVLNEIFTSTTLDDAVYIGTKVLDRIIDLDALCVCVTFIDEFASLSASTVSMMSTVDPHDPARRTFKVIRKPPDGLAYALAIAAKYRLDYENLVDRLAS
ncbi:MAG: hypothetical protein M0Z51_09630 [Propionibacterium sp.]|nr:hypothetical protein [Propionibacterium sp.]